MIFGQAFDERLRVLRRKKARVEEGVERGVGRLIVELAVLREARFEAPLSSCCAALIREMRLHLGGGSLLERDENLVHHYSTLWSLEFKSAPVTDHPQIRERVRRDLARLVPLLASDPDLSFVVFHGFDLLEDDEGRRRAEETILEEKPGSFHALQITLERFNH